MNRNRSLQFGLIFVMACLIAGLIARVEAGQGSGSEAIHIKPVDIGGVVTSSKGPEAGVWVIAETTDLPTKFVKIVVTDDRGRYLIPDLPKASYEIWVRGYGLVDSTPVDVTPGKLVYLKATIAPTPKDAAQYYPADYWYSLIQVPDKSEFPMKPTPAPPFKTNMAAAGSSGSSAAMTPASAQQGGATPARGTAENEETLWARPQRHLEAPHCWEQSRARHKRRPTARRLFCASPIPICPIRCCPVCT